MKNIAVYYRVSTDLQDFDSQKVAIERWLKDKEYERMEVFTDVGSGAKDDRPQYNTMIKQAMASEFDTVLVYALDRFSRSAITAITAILELDKAGCKFISATQPMLDTSQPFGKTLIMAFSEIAELERETIVKRIKDGIAAHREKHGMHSGMWGGPMKAKWDRIERAIEMREVEGVPWKYVLRYLNCSLRHARRLFKAHKEGTLGKVILEPKRKRA